MDINIHNSTKTQKAEEAMYVQRSAFA